VISVDVPPEPFNGGHIVLRTGKPIFDLTHSELAMLKQKIDKILVAVKEKLRPEGFNIYVNGNEVHIIPRWCGDINVAFFGGIKVVPLSNKDVAELLGDEFNN